MGLAARFRGRRACCAGLIAGIRRGRARRIASGRRAGGPGCIRSRTSSRRIPRRRAAGGLACRNSAGGGSFGGALLDGPDGRHLPVRHRARRLGGSGPLHARIDASHRNLDISGGAGPVVAVTIAASCSPGGGDRGPFVGSPGRRDEHRGQAVESCRALGCGGSKNGQQHGGGRHSSKPHPGFRPMRSALVPLALAEGCCRQGTRGRRGVPGPAGQPQRHLGTIPGRAKYNVPGSFS